MADTPEGQQTLASLRARAANGSDEMRAYLHKEVLGVIADGSTTIAPADLARAVLGTPDPSSNEHV